MKKVDVVTNNLKRYKYLTKEGLSSPSLLNHFDIYKQYIKCLAKGIKKSECIISLAETFNTSKRNIRTAIRNMEFDVLAKRVYSKAKVRRELADKGYILTGTEKKGYLITDKYSKVGKHISSLNEADAFLLGNYINHNLKIVHKKISPINR